MQIEQLYETYLRLFPGARPTIATLGPGRVNLLGEHTDYNEGFVLPMAIDAHITLLGGSNNSDRVNLYSLDFNARDSFSLQDISLTKTNLWSNYIRGVCFILIEAGFPLSGMNIVLQGNVPVGAGLSSSAALEVATALFVTGVNQLTIDRVELVKIAQKAENDFVGVNCGIMDQFASMMGVEDHALFLDCRTLDYQLVAAPFKQLGYAVVVINSGVQRGLVDSEYNLRRAQCEAAVLELKKELAGIATLRDVSIDHLDIVSNLPAELRKRARHVITENQRVFEGVKALQAGNLQTFGRLITASHKSLRDDYEVSRPELDLLVELCQSVPATLGAGMTGAGFGGSVISLVAETAVAELKDTLGREYEQQTGITPEIFVFEAAQGAKIVKLG